MNLHPIITREFTPEETEALTALADRADDVLWDEKHENRTFRNGIACHSPMMGKRAEMLADRITERTGHLTEEDKATHIRVVLAGYRMKMPSRELLLRRGGDEEDDDA